MSVIHINQLSDSKKKKKTTTTGDIFNDRHKQKP